MGVIEFQFHIPCGPWSGTSSTEPGGLCRFDGTSFISFTSQDADLDSAVYDVLAATDGSIWLGNLNGAFRFDPVTMRSYGTADGLDRGAAFGLAVTPDEECWVLISEESGRKVARFDGTRWHKVGTAEGLVGSAAYAILVEEDGSLVVSDVLANGVRLPPRSERSGGVRFEPLGGLTGAYCLLRSNDGELWYGTDVGARIVGETEHES